MKTIDGLIEEINQTVDELSIVTSKLSLLLDEILELKNEQVRTH